MAAPGPRVARSDGPRHRSGHHVIFRVLVAPELWLVAVPIGRVSAVEYPDHVCSGPVGPIVGVAVVGRDQRDPATVVEQQFEFYVIHSRLLLVGWCLDCPNLVSYLLVNGDVDHQKDSGYAHEGEAVDEVVPIH